MRIWVFQIFSHLYGWSYTIETIGVANPATGWQGVADWQTPGDPWKTEFDNLYGSAANNPFNNHTQVFIGILVGLNASTKEYFHKIPCLALVLMLVLLKEPLLLCLIPQV